MQKTYQIRYNTHSTDESNRWRLICDDEQIFVKDIYITSRTYTTKDFVGDIQDYKYHITCAGYLKIHNGTAYITTSDEKRANKRHLLKTISYRLMATLITVGTAIFLGLDLKFSALLGVGEMVVKPIFYYLHERFWYRLRFPFK